MSRHSEISDTDLHIKLGNKNIRFDGNSQLKIYGTLNCSSGKRLKRDDRVFFESESEAKNETYRPCGQCMKSDYRQWIYSENQ